MMDCIDDTTVITDVDFEGHLGAFEDLGPATEHVLRYIAHAMTVAEDAQGILMGLRDLADKYGPKKISILRDFVDVIARAERGLKAAFDDLNDVFHDIEEGLESFVDDLADPDLADDEGTTDAEYAAEKAAAEARWAANSAAAAAAGEPRMSRAEQLRAEAARRLPK